LCVCVCLLCVFVLWAFSYICVVDGASVDDDDAEVGLMIDASNDSFVCPCCWPISLLTGILVDGICDEMSITLPCGWLGISFVGSDDRDSASIGSLVWG
jgi:hypothetical protein